MPPTDAVAGLLEAAEHAADVAAAPPASPFVAFVGDAAPESLAWAVGARAVRLLPAPTDPADPIHPDLPSLHLGWRARSWLRQVLELGRRPLAVVFSGPRPDATVAYSVLREAAATRELDLAPCLHVDLPGLGYRTTAVYRRRRLVQARRRLLDLAGTTGAGDAEATIRSVAEERDRRLARLADLARSDRPSVAARELLLARRAGAWLGPSEHVELLDSLIRAHESDTGAAGRTGRRALVIASDLPIDVAVAMDDRDVVVGLLDPTRVGAPGGAPTAASTSSEDVVAHVHDAALAHRAEVIQVVSWEGDEPDLWDAARIEHAPPPGVAVERVRLPDGSADAVLHAVTGRSDRRPSPSPTGTPPKARPGRDRGGDRGGDRAERSRKTLTATESFAQHQRAWFDEVTARARDGEPFAVVNADFPHELLRAMDIPYVVNQWWASVVGAKRQSPGFMAALADHGYAADVEPYSTHGLASAFVPPDEQPWGGLPRPTIVGAMLGTAPTAKVFRSWGHETGAEVVLVERTPEGRWDPPRNWWEVLPEHWDTALEPARLDLLRDELVGVIRTLERTTGRVFDEDVFHEVLDLANQQALASRRTRDLIARTHPCPAGIVDQMPATMIPQWHRGTHWAADAARRVGDEVAGRADAGMGVVDPERVRLMWVGRGFWGNTALYQSLEHSHGAVFVWSMYLGLAADGYLRHLTDDQDPLRALASRFVTMGDELRMPSWAAPWHVKEAHAHGVDGAVAVSDADPFVVEALRASGVPVLELPLHNLQADASDRALALLEPFVEDLARDRAPQTN